MKETALIKEVNSKNVVFLRMSFKARTSELEGFDNKFSRNLKAETQA